MDADRFIKWVINESHIFIAVACQAVVFVLDRTGHAIAPSTQQTVNWFYGMLGTHFAASQIWPDDKPGIPKQ